MNNRTIGLKILFGTNYWLWRYDPDKLSFVTPYFLSEQMAKYGHLLYSQIFHLTPTSPPLLVWDMFGGIATDTIYLSRYFNIISTELDGHVHSIALENVRNFNRTNINLVNDNCFNMIGKIQPDIIYFDPPWGDTYRSRLKNFDFSNVYLDFPAEATSHLPNLPRKVSCLDLLKYLYMNISRNIIIKSPINSITFEKEFSGSLEYIHRCTNKNLKFIFLKDKT